MGGGENCECQRHGSSGVTQSHLTRFREVRCLVWGLWASRPTVPACPCLSELEGVKFCAWLLAHCGLWLGQNICLLLWLPYT